MMALGTVHKDIMVSKDEIIRLAQPHCDSSFTKVDPGAGKFYTAWNRSVISTNHAPEECSLTNLKHKNFGR